MIDIFIDKNPNRIVFHFNKAYLADPTIPMWVLKHKGQTYYVDHVKSAVPFNTKNTPDSEHTKGSLLVRGTLHIRKEGEETHAYIDFG